MGHVQNSREIQVRKRRPEIHVHWHTGRDMVEEGLGKHRRKDYPRRVHQIFRQPVPEGRSERKDYGCKEVHQQSTLPRNHAVQQHGHRLGYRNAERAAGAGGRDTGNEKRSNPVHETKIQRRTGNQRNAPCVDRQLCRFADPAVHGRHYTDKHTDHAAARRRREPAVQIRQLGQEPTACRRRYNLRHRDEAAPRSRANRPAHDAGDIND